MGDASANVTLSLQRAEAIRNWLVAGAQVQASILSVEGMGENDPVAPNTNPEDTDNPDGRARNRRVTVTIEGA